MKRLSFSYHLEINTDHPVKGHSFRLMCVPFSDGRQDILSLNTQISPADFIGQGCDSWGNRFLYGSFSGPHNQFFADISGEALVGKTTCIASSQPHKDHIFLYPTALTKPDPALLSFSEKTKAHFSSNTAQAETVMNALFEKMQYVPGSTTVKTTAGEAFSAGTGVCQDYSHIMLSVLRSQGIPARYAAGMLMGEGKSHAWVEVLQDGYWYGFDPTNCKRVTDEHIVLCRGKDYGDCALNRGVFRGFANQNTTHFVKVKEIL